MTSNTKQIYRQIDENILKQREFYHTNSDGDLIVLEGWYEVQDEINRLYSVVAKANERAKSDKTHREFMNVNKVDNRKTKSDYLWLTVNPRPDVPLQHFVETCHKAFKLSVFESGSYVFEQRGTMRGQYEGFHCHALMKRSKIPSVVKAEMKRVFSPLVGNDNHIRITWVDDSQLEKINKYMSGQKKDKDKEPKAMNDVFFRQDNSLLTKYTIRTPENLLGGAVLRPKLKLKKT